MCFILGTCICLVSEPVLLLSCFRQHMFMIDPNIRFKLLALFCFNVLHLFIEELF